MGVKRFDALRHIVTRGDMAPVAAGQPVSVRAGKRRNYNVAEGQLVFYVKEGATTRTVDAASLTVADIPKLLIGVGHIQDKKKGIVDSIRHIGVEHISGCNLESLDVSAPRCGTPDVVDFYFGCIDCDHTYTVKVGVDDNLTRSYAPFMKSEAEYFVSATPDCNSCDNCPQEATCDAIVCDLVDRLNDDIREEFHYPDYKGMNKEIPYRAVKLHDRSLIYCLSPIDTDGAECKNCYAFAGINKVVVGEASVDLVGTLNPADNTQTLRAQIQSIADQINEAFEAGPGRHAGHAFITGNEFGTCCPIQLHVNTCDANFAIRNLADDADIVPTKDYNPFTAHGSLQVDPNCQDCGSAPTTRNFDCGIRVIAAPIDATSSCYLEKPLAFYGRKVNIYPIGDGWAHKQWKVENVQRMVLPSGFGSWIQYQEYRQPVGGSGRDYSWSNTNQGWLNLPDARSRVVNAITADADEDYCSYHLISSYPKTNALSERAYGRVYSHVHIPSGDTTTKTAFENFLVALAAFSPGCPPVEAVTCEPFVGACAE
jgi:hypothetical protein